MKRLMNFFFLSCQKSTELFEKKQDHGISPIEEMRLKMHTSMCKFCNAYQKNSKIIDLGLSINAQKAKERGSNKPLNDADHLKEKINNRLNKK